MRRPPPARKSRRPLQDLVLLLEPLHLPPQPGQLGGLGLLPRHGLGRAGREVLVAPAPELVGMDPESLGDLLQGLAALRQPLDRLGLVLGREPAPLPLLHRSFPVLVDPTLRGCPPSRGRLTVDELRTLADETLEWSPPSGDEAAGKANGHVGEQASGGFGGSSGEEIPEISGWPEPEPIEGPLLPVERFDYRLLPETLCPWVRDVVTRMQVPPE